MDCMNLQCFRAWFDGRFDITLIFQGPQKDEHLWYIPDSHGGAVCRCDTNGPVAHIFRLTERAPLVLACLVILLNCFLFCSSCNNTISRMSKEDVKCASCHMHLHRTCPSVRPCRPTFTDCTQKLNVSVSQFGFQVSALSGKMLAFFTYTVWHTALLGAGQARARRIMHGV